MSEDRFGDLGRREPSAAERFAELDEGDMEAERRQREEGPPGPPRPGGRYTWVVGVAALLALIVVAFNSLPNAGRGYRGPEQGERIPVFAVPDVRGEREGDANVKQDAGDETNNETAACEVELSDVITACELFEERPLVLSLSVPADDCRRQLAAAERLQREFPQVQFAAVVSGRSMDTAREHAEDAGVTFPVGVDRDLAVFNLYRIAYCSTAFAERGGVLREFHANRPLSEEALREEVRRLVEP